ncbi:YdhK family protein [Chryseobacterium sp. ISL-80]|nr:YdhK family protein [Chryseobacterium sp. ISL-80]
MTNNKLLRNSGLGLAALGLVFSAAGVSAEAHNPGAKFQPNNQIVVELNDEKKLAIVEKKVIAVETKIEDIETSLGEAPLTAAEVEMYEKYLEDINPLLNRLNAAENQLDAKVKNQSNPEPIAEEIYGWINEVRSKIIVVKETMESQLAETMSSSGEVPEELATAENPKFEIGSQAIIEADHMPGMKGALATIKGAYDTTAYSITYYPTTGGEPVKDHKWVIHEELENPGEEPLEPGTEVTLNADHMEGMDGATAIIESAVDTTVYMLDFTTTYGEKVENHKWITESELKSIE